MDLSQIELSILNIIANHPDQYLIAKDHISTKDFTSVTTQGIWDAMARASDQGIEPGGFQVRTFVTDETARDLLTSFLGHSVGRHVLPYCQTLKRQHREVKFRNALREALSDGVEDPATLVERAVDAYRSSGESKHIGITELATQTFDYLDSVSQGMIGVPTGLRMIDDRIGGLQEGRLVVIAARPGIGKTALSLQISLHAAMHKYPVGTCSLEMSEQELGVRTLSHLYRVNVSQLFRAEDDALARVSAGMGNIDLGSLPMLFNCEQYRLDEICSQIRLWKKRDGIALAVVDHIGLVEVPGAMNANDRVGQVSRALKKLSKELRIPIIAVSQLNRGSEREGRKPTLADLRDSGSVEQDCDIAIFIHASDEDQYLLGLLKNRQGPKGWIRDPVRFIGSIQRFVEGP